MVGKEMQRLAVALGIQNAHAMDIRELIARIQAQEGSVPCFSQSWSAPCRIHECPVCGRCTSHMHGHA